MALAQLMSDPKFEMRRNQDGSLYPVLVSKPPTAAEAFDPKRPLPLIALQVWDLGSKAPAENH